MDLQTTGFTSLSAPPSRCTSASPSGRVPVPPASSNAAGGSVPPVMNGMATAADWMSAASFISMAGLISNMGYGGGLFLMGWTGGYVLLAMLLAPYLRKFGKFTVPQFIGDRFYSKTASTVAVLCLLTASLTYIIGQMTGVGVAFSRFLGVSSEVGIYVGMGIVFLYAVFGGMKGITYTQVAQYIVLIAAYIVPAIFISLNLTGNPIPQLGLGSNIRHGHDFAGQAGHGGDRSGLRQVHDHDSRQHAEHVRLHDVADDRYRRSAARHHAILHRPDGRRRAQLRRLGAGLHRPALHDGACGCRDGQAEPPPHDHPRRCKAGGDLYATDASIKSDERPDWMKRWEKTGLLKFTDKNGDGRIQYYNDATKSADFKKKAADAGWKGNELTVNADIIVLANPEIALLPNWVIALVAAGGLAAALSTAAGLLMAISAAVSHDLVKNVFMPGISEKGELMAGKISMAVAIVIAGWLGLNPPGFAAGTVALAFGIAASSLFPAIMMGIFSKKMNKEGAIAGMLSGLFVTLFYVFAHKGIFFIKGTDFLPMIGGANSFFGITPEAFGAIGALVNFAVAFAVDKVTKEPPEHIQHMVESVRIPRGSKAVDGAH